MADNYAVALDNHAISANSVTVQSPSLIKGLVKNPNATIALLSAKFAPVNLSDIDIDPQGKVVINNQAFRDALNAAPPTARSSAGDNCAC